MLVWKTQTLDINVASLRYRALLPLRYLKALGVSSEVYGGKDPVKFTPQTQALIFVKSFHHRDVATCKRAYAQGVPIILDLCDNIFIEGYGTGSDHSPAENFLKMAEMAIAIVATGTEMKAEIEAAISSSSGAHSPLIVAIPDGSESLDDIRLAARAFSRERPLNHRLKSFLKGPLKGPIKYFRAKQLVTFIQEPKPLKQAIKNLVKRKVLGKSQEPAKSKTSPPQAAKKSPQKASKKGTQPTPLQPEPWPPAPGVKTVLWFGNHGAKYGNFGMLNVLDVAPALEALSQECALRLLVVSNHRKKYETHVAPLPFQTNYLPWHPREIYSYIRKSDVVVVPNSQSRYSICKSANRTVLALSQETPVVASETPALEMLSGCVWLDDWESGLREYLLHPQTAQAHVKQAQQIIEQNLSGKVIAQEWMALLNQIAQLSSQHSSSQHTSSQHTSSQNSADRIAK